MKKIFLLSLFISCFSNQLFSHQNNLRIFTEWGERFTLFINGYRYNPYPENNVRINNLDNPNYQLKIVFHDRFNQEVFANIYLPSPNTEYTFLLSRREGLYRVIEQRRVCLNYTPPPPCENRNFPSNNNWNNPYNPSRWNENQNHYYQEYNNPSHNSYPPIPSSPSQPTQCLSPVPAMEFSSALNLIASQSFDRRRMIIAKQVIENNYFNAAQVREMVLLFSFDDSKLEIAQYAYARTVDKENYYKVMSTFTFDSTMEKLHRFISGQARCNSYQ